jgi:hypothetical protein
MDKHISDEPTASSFSVEDTEEGVEKSSLLSNKLHSTTLVLEAAQSISLLNHLSKGSLLLGYQNL